MYVLHTHTPHIGIKHHSETGTESADSSEMPRVMPTGEYAAKSTFVTFMKQQHRYIVHDEGAGGG